jgi:hypothetical protein
MNVSLYFFGVEAMEEDEQHDISTGEMSWSLSGRLVSDAGAEEEEEASCVM